MDMRYIAANLAYNPYDLRAELEWDDDNNGGVMWLDGVRIAYCTGYDSGEYTVRYTPSFCPHGESSTPPLAGSGATWGELFKFTDKQTMADTLANFAMDQFMLGLAPNTIAIKPIGDQDQFGRMLEVQWASTHSIRFELSDRDHPLGIAYFKNGEWEGQMHGCSDVWRGDKQYVTHAMLTYALNLPSVSRRIMGPRHVVA